MLAGRTLVNGIAPAREQRAGTAMAIPRTSTPRRGGAALDRDAGEHGGGGATPPHAASTRAALRIALFVVIVIVAVLLLALSGLFDVRPKVAIVTSSQDPYWDLVIDGAERAADRYDVRLTVVRSPGDEIEQTRQVEALLARERFHGVAISPINPSTQTQLLTDIAARSTLITMDSDSPVLERLCFIGTDNYTAGRMCGEEVREAVPDGGTIVVSVGSLKKENGRLRHQGLIDELTGRSFERSRTSDDPAAPVAGGKYTILTRVDDLDPVRATELAAAAIREHPDVRCFVGLFAYSTPALLAALEQGGRRGEVKVVAFDVNEQTLAGIESGAVEATIMQDQYGCGFTAVRILADAARGNRAGLPAFQMHYLGCNVVTKDNVANVRRALRRTEKDGRNHG